MEFTQSAALFLIPILVFCITEIVKIVNYIRKNGRNASYFSLLDGHMPSAHTAYVSSLVTMMWLFEGYKSPVFAIALILATIVITDALKLRAHVGHQAEYLNHIVRHLNLDTKEFPPLKIHVGHKPKEVAAGAIFGILLTLLFTAFVL